MNKLCRWAVAAVFAAVVFGAPAASSEDKSVTVINSAITGFIIPAHKQFSTAAQKLASNINDLCAAPSDAQLQSVYAGFDGIVSAWASVSIIRIGPILEHNRLEKLLFWPDRRGIGLRQVQAILAKQDTLAISTGGLAEKSVAVLGLAALEFVLYGEGSELLSQKTDEYRCRFAKAISVNINDLAYQLLTEWQAPDGFANTWQNPGPDNALFHDEKEALSALVSVFANGMEYYHTVEIGGFLGLTPEKDRPRQALFRRSDNTLRFLRKTLSDFQLLYQKSALRTLLPASSDWIDEAIGFGFKHGNASLASLSGSAAQILENPQKRAKLAYVGTVVRGLNENFGIDLTAALDLTANFSSLDGD
ncbi:MAG: peptidase M75, Imelysin [Hyphomicrobiales bacterium]|nr:peptidase M75, Imelysin [Hyphomicrobiales bacterium]MCP5000091.1 peptidase M75, Imelysin [Hyphomicrobiales bacterium]